LVLLLAGWGSVGPAIQAPARPPIGPPAGRPLRPLTVIYLDFPTQPPSPDHLAPRTPTLYYILMPSRLHEALADALLANPSARQRDIAKQLGVTEAWLSTVKNSDAFKAYYEKRRKEFNEKLHEATVAKLYATAIEAAQRVLEAVGDEDCPADFALEALDTSLKRLGYGAGGTSVVIDNSTTQLGVAVVDRGILEEARRRMLNGVAENRPAALGGSSGAARLLEAEPEADRGEGEGDQVRAPGAPVSD